MNVKLKRHKYTRNLESTRAEILKASFFLVFRQGFQGVSIDDIVKETKYTKGALYHLFPTKLDLGYALVDEVIKPMIIERWITPLEGYKNPLDGILMQMQKLIGNAKPDELKLGCPLNNLVQEMAPIDKGFKKRLRAALNLWIDKIEEHLKRAQARGFLKSGVDTRQVAHFVVMAHEGFYGLIKGLGGSVVYKALMSSLTNYFQQISTNDDFKKT